MNDIDETELKRYREWALRLITYDHRYTNPGPYSDDEMRAIIEIPYYYCIDDVNMDGLPTITRK